MYSFFRALIVSFAWLCLLITDSGWAKDPRQKLPKLGIQIGASAWFNNSDVPAGGQDTRIRPSFGPSFQLTYKKVFVEKAKSCL